MKSKMFGYLRAALILALAFLLTAALLGPPPIAPPSRSSPGTGILRGLAPPSFVSEKHQRNN